MTTAFPSRWRRAIDIALWLCLIGYVMGTVHDFYVYIDRSIYVSVDDGEANVSYALATEGRYAFLTSPVLIDTSQLRGLDMSRLNGQFNYGPWYFYLGAGLVWLFGYSLTLLRSIHLFVLLGAVALAAMWFRGPDRPTLAALFGLGLLRCFIVVQWPMVRPDIMVSAFAVVLCLSAGMAILRPRALLWYVAGLVGACAAFSHLIAWGLVPATFAIFVGASVVAWRDGGEARSGLKRSAMGLILGVATGVMMFYASFGFRIDQQLAFLRAYRQLTASTDSYLTILVRHFNLAYSFISPGLRPMVASVLVLGWATLVLGAVTRRLSREDRQFAAAYLLPPLAIWTCYLLTLGWYANTHMGYELLNQVFAWWTAAALIWIWLQWLRLWSPRIAPVVSTAVAVGVLASGFRLMAPDGQLVDRKVFFARDRTEFMYGLAEWVPISKYVDHILDQLPARATVWGSVMYGIESPARVQLVQVTDALSVSAMLPDDLRAEFAPDYIMWGYVETRDSVESVLRGQHLSIRMIDRWFPQERYVLTSLIYGAPYGVTRVYARMIREHGTMPPALPSVSVFDVVRGEWRQRMSDPLPVTFAEQEPLAFRIGYKNLEPSKGTATRTLGADVPAGVYLVRVTVRPGTGSENGLIAVTSKGQSAQTISELGPEGDFAPYFPADSTVDLLHAHRGGTLSVSQFDSGSGSGLVSAELRSVVPLVDTPRQRRYEPPIRLPVASWAPYDPATIRVTADQETLLVEGNATQDGYQVKTPPIGARPGGTVAIRVTLRQETGRVCVGVLNRSEAKWLVQPLETKPDYEFTIDQSGGFRVVLGNCNPGASGNPPSRFRIEEASWYQTGLYVDRLMQALRKTEEAAARRGGAPPD